MKYLKLFNEELKYDTYRRAASGFDYYNKSDKSKALYDYADEKQFGFYRLHLANDASLISKDLTFTDPRLIGIYYGSDKYPNILSRGVNVDEVANQSIKNWVNGDKLSIIFKFALRPTRETMSKIVLGSGYVTVFSIELELSEAHGGIEEWDSEAKWQAEVDGEEFIPSDVHKFYEWTKCVNLYIGRPNSPFFAIFSDRKSALKFKNYVISIIDEKIKESIVDLLTIVSNDAQDIDNAINGIKKMSLNGLYDTDPDKKGSRGLLLYKWYDKKI